MKQLIFITLSILLLFGCKNDSKVETKNIITIKGKVEFPFDQFQMKITKSDGFDKITIDSLDLNEDNTYEFTMKVKEPGRYTLDCQKQQRVTFWADDEDLVINFRGKDTAKVRKSGMTYVHIHGGRNNDLMNAYAIMNTNFYWFKREWITNTYVLFDEEMAPYKANMRKVIDPVFNAQGKIYNRFLFDQYLDCDNAYSLLSNFEGEEFDAAVAKMETANPGNPHLKKYLQERLERESKRGSMKVGAVAPDFEYENLEGELVSLKDYRGKLLVVDFWASWCGPCRHEIPNLKKTHQKYHEKGIEFLSVSIDKSEAKWRESVEEENMPWEQLRTDDVGKKVMKNYQFRGIPFIILLDTDGKIVAKQLRGDELTQEIEKQLK